MMYPLTDSLIEWAGDHPWTVGLIISAWCVIAPPLVDWMIERMM